MNNSLAMMFGEKNDLMECYRDKMLSITIPCYENLTTSAGSAKTLMKNFACNEERSQSVQITKQKLLPLVLIIRKSLLFRFHRMFDVSSAYHKPDKSNIL
jgi:hypothetical protein